MILDKIYSHKLKEVSERKSIVTIETLKEKCKGLPKTRKFSKAIKRNGKNDRIKIIAEVKKASPSAGVIREDFNYVNIAMEYEAS